MAARAAARRTLAEARAHHGRAELDQALQAYARTLRQDPGLVEARWGLVAILEMARTPSYHRGLATLLEECLADERAHAQALARAAAHQIRLRYGIRAAAPEPAGWSSDALAVLGRDRLLHHLLRRCVNLDPALERFLTVLRRHLLQAGTPVQLALATAMAQQCHNNEHVWWEEPDEAAQVAGLAAGFELGQATPFEVARLAMYRRLDELPGAERWAGQAADLVAPALHDLVQQSLLDGIAERAIAASLPAFSPIEDETSALVRSQYEQHPYPRWLTLPPLPLVDILAELGRSFPALTEPPAAAAPLQVLSAGCGTGQHALSLARNYRGAQVTAIDITRRSLAYAVRQAQHLGIANVEFLHGDILHLPRLGRRFQIVESIGVIHHMADPGAGLAAFTEVLEPRGLVRLGLYSEVARRPIAAARQRIGALGLDGSTGSIRRFRRLLMTDPAHRDLATLTRWDDFFATSTVRDLMFHVHEHCFTVPRIGAMLARCGLDFIGFEFLAGFSHDQRTTAGIREQYRRAFPDDPAMANLGHWAVFEERHPELFAGYSFWAQKP